MSELTVATDGIRKYGSTSTEAAGRIAQAAAVDLGANIAAVAPAVGPVGIEFLEAFARAQATHTKDVAALATFYAGNAATAGAAAQAYDTTDHAIANRSDRCGRIDGRDRVSTEDDSTTVIEFLHGGAPAPVLPNNVVESMLAGIPVPALPGIEDLFAPLIELGKSLGTGTFAGIDPVGIFDQASTLIDHAMGLSRSAVADVGQTWNSTGSDAATELSRSAQNSGAELSERGTAISKTAAAAAESVQRGNANLAAIAQSFATTVAAAAPIAWTPPGQAMLLASAAEHMQAAVAAVTRTRGEMLGHTAAMNALAGPIPVPTPPTSEALSNLVTAEAINNAARQIAQPLSASTDAGDAPYSTHPDSTQPGTEAVRTSAARAGAGLPTGVDKLWGAGNPSTSLAAGASPSPSATASSGGAWVSGSGGTTGGMVRGAAGVAAVQPVPVTTPGLGAPSSAVGSSGMSPGGMLGGGPRGSRDDESSRTTPRYLVTAGDENSMVDDLPMVSPPVLGADDPDQYLFRDL